MGLDELFELLKVDLGKMHIPEAEALFLLNLLEQSVQYIRREGADITLPCNYEDAGLIVSYAAYLYRKRGTDEPMPRHLRWRLNNRIFGEKAGS